MQLNSYLSFSGNCEEALKLYGEALGGKIEYKMLYSDNKDMCKNLPADWQNKIMHASFRAGDVFFMASDVLVGDDSSCGLAKLVPEGSPITLSLSFESEAEETKVFNKLAEGGKVTMPLQNTFWGSHFGMLTDKFGIKWMFSFDKSNKK
jgi:PhnB protein